MQIPVETHADRDPAVPLARNKHLRKWVEKMAQLTQPDSIYLGRWLEGRIRRALQPDGGRRHLHQVE